MTKTKQDLVHIIRRLDKLELFKKQTECPHPHCEIGFVLTPRFHGQATREKVCGKCLKVLETYPDKESFTQSRFEWHDESAKKLKEILNDN